MTSTEHIAARRQKAHRRLSELEIAVGIGGELDLTWHIAQAARSGATLGEVLDALKRGMEMRDTPDAALTQSADDLADQVSGVQSRSWPTRESVVELLTPC